MLNGLKGKDVAIVAMGKSQLDYHMSISHSKEYYEVWAINSMCAVVKPDRVFVMDPVSRFFETDGAGPQTKVLQKTLPKLKCPIYSCELDKRVPSLELYPLEKVIQKLIVGISITQLPMPLLLLYTRKYRKSVFMEPISVTQPMSILVNWEEAAVNFGWPSA